jgi:tRNA threonylcarbamoyladenosine biosynthesis protein TsaB
MKILAVDTTEKSCSVAIVDKKIPVAEMTLCLEQTHSKHLMSMINTAVTISGINMSDLDGFAVSKGPGSFTGLRIGMGSIKGLAAAKRKPVVGVSSLEALAMQGSFLSYPVCPLLDARKGEVYFSRYRFENNILKREIDEQVLPLDIAVGDICEPCIFVGDGASAYKDIIIKKLCDFAYFAPVCQNKIRASTVADISMAKFENNDTDELRGFVPSYIRKSYAELSLKTSD